MVNFNNLFGGETLKAEFTPFTNKNNTKEITERYIKELNQEITDNKSTKERAIEYGESIIKKLKKTKQGLEEFLIILSEPINYEYADNSEINEILDEIIQIKNGIEKIKKTLKILGEDLVMLKKRDNKTLIYDLEKKRKNYK